MRVAIIAALGENRVIGREQGLPWRLPRDLEHFKRLTLRHPVIMGRRTFETLAEPLPQRQNIVVTSNQNYERSDAQVAHSLDEAVEMAVDEEVAFICGGAGIYREGLKRADCLYLTLVEGTFEGDTFFPPYDPSDWKETSREHHEADDRNLHAMTFLTLER